MYDLHGKVALVTGASGESGLGSAIALRLAQDGADVAVNDILPGTPDSTTIHELESLGRRALGVVADVSDATQVDAMMDLVLRTFGKIDILVNNAAAPAGADRVPVVDLDEATWDLVQRVNVKGTFLCCRAAARLMIRQGQGGKIINVSSLLGKQGRARYAAYSASKFAIIGLTQSLALELAPHRINVNAVCPGLVDTSRLDDIAASLASSDVAHQSDRQAFAERVAAANPMGRIAQPADVSGVAAFLASSDSDYLTGLAITVAGGSYME